MKKVCPECDSKINLTNVFTFKSIICSECKSPLKVDLIYRNTLILSFVLLYFWYIYAIQKNSVANSMVLWGGLFFCVAPFIWGSRRALMVKGSQTGLISLVVNLLYILVCIGLLYVFLVGFKKLRKANFLS